MNSFMIAGVFTGIYFLVSLYLCRRIRLDIRALTLGSIACALTLVLSMIYIPLPTGASIPCGAMLPLMVLALVYDPRLAIASGWVCGVLAALLLPTWQPVHVGQIFVEHMVCFSCLGYAGWFGRTHRWNILCGAVVASVLKITGHLVSGVLFFSQNAWSGWGAWGYSLMYNLTSNVPEAVLAIVLILMVPLAVLEKVSKGNFLRDTVPSL